MIANKNYGEKTQHGLHWGISEFIGGWRVGLPEYGGNCRRLKDQNLDLVAGPVIVLGNIWAHKDPQEAKRFRHPDEYQQRNIEWYCWDNPQLPHLLYQGPHNPKGFKNWMRITSRDTCTRDQPLRQGQQGSARINSQLKSITGGKISTWQDLARPHTVQSRGRRVLLCPSGSGIFPKYYGLEKEQWIRERTEQLTRLGYEVVLRDKPSRSMREINDNRLYQVLERTDFAFTVSIHSVSPVESILAGVPAVVEGRHCSGPLGTPWEEFIDSGQLRCPQISDVEQWIDRILCDTFHKTEAYSGKWH